VQQTCLITSVSWNIGDGNTVCFPEGETYHPPKHFRIRENITIHRFDSFHFEAKKFGAVKIDIEGFECRFLRGAMEFFNRSDAPRYVVTEFSPRYLRSAGTAQPIDYLRMWNLMNYDCYMNGFFDSKGYEVTENSTTFISPLRYAAFVNESAFASIPEDLYWIKHHH